MTDVILSPLAKADMMEIGDYISRQLQNPGAAKRQIQRFRETILPVGDFPEMGTPLPAPGRQSPTYRYLVCGSYMIFYHLSDASVLIDRILYGRRDYLMLLFGEQFRGDHHA